MGRAVVVYESVFGDAQAIARSIGAGLAPSMRVDVIPVGSAPTELDEDISLLVVGCPTHQFGMPRASSREQAAADSGEAPVSGSISMREWFDAVEGSYPHLAAAAFDTRMDHPAVLKHVDHASHTEEKRLRRLDCFIVAPAEHFYVTGAQGPLVEGETDRARQWGEHLAELASHRPTEPTA